VQLAAGAEVAEVRAGGVALIVHGWRRICRDWWRQGCRGRGREGRQRDGRGRGAAAGALRSSSLLLCVLPLRMYGVSSCLVAMLCWWVSLVQPWCVP
jgi:hypothetical protein